MHAVAEREVGVVEAADMQAVRLGETPLVAIGASDAHVDVPRWHHGAPAHRSTWASEAPIATSGVSPSLTASIGRLDNAHLAFGNGVHRCLGVAATRMLMHVTLEALLRHGAEHWLARRAGGGWGAAALGDPIPRGAPSGVRVGMSDLDTLIGKALTDPTFCDRLLSDPERVLSDHDVPFDPELLAAIRQLDADALRRLAGAFGKEQAAG